MKNVILLIIILLTYIHPLLAQKTPEYLWGRNAGGEDVTTDNNGHLYTIGRLQDTLHRNGQTHISKGDLDIILSKLDLNGNIIWERSFGSPGRDFGDAVCCDAAGNLYVWGEFSIQMVIGSDTLSGKSHGSFDYFIAKFDSSGNPLWAKQVLYPGDRGLSNIAADNMGNLYIGAGLAITPGDTLELGNQKFTGNGKGDIYVMKLDPAGDFIWTRQFASPESEGVSGVATDAMGAVYITGFIRDTILFNPILTQQKIFLSKYDSSGNMQFIVTPNKGKGNGFDIAVDQSGNIYQCGQFDDTVVFGNSTLYTNEGASTFLTKYDNSGNVLWAKSYQHSKFQHALRMAISSDDEIYLNIVIGDVSLVKYNSDGDLVWSNEYGPHQDPPDVVGLCTDSYGNLYFTGMCNLQNNTYGNDTVHIPPGNTIEQFIAKAGPFAASVGATIKTKDTIMLYPNPNNGNFIVRGNSLRRYKNYDVISLTGQSVASGHLLPVGKGAEVSTGPLAEGIYILRLSGEEGITSLTFRIE